MRQKPLLISLLISLGTGVIAYGTIPGNVPPAIIAAGMGISGGVADPLCINGNCRIQNIHERSKSRSTEIIPDPAGSKLLMADTFL